MAVTEKFCKKCAKPLLADHAGSVTSFFFQHNYCQCNSKKEDPARTKVLRADNEICKNCGKSRPTSKRAGSFTSFLFKELRCTCAGSSVKKLASPANSNRSGVNIRGGRTTTAARTAQRRQFTQNFRNTQIDKAPQAILPKGSVVGGAFKIISLIGVGGMGVVYKVEHTALRRELALKILTPELVNEQSWQRFKAEAKTLASLSHSTLVEVYDLGIHEQQIPFYSMDYLNGRSVEQILAEDGPISLRTSIDILLEVLDGLAYAHRHGIVHRDLKPGNIMVCTINGAPRVKVLDFGISKLIGKADAQTLTVAGDIFGSPFYMSPEQGAGHSVDARSDIYSIGCTFFEMLTGFVPYENPSSIEMLLMHQEADIPFLADVSDLNFPQSVDFVLAKCLAKSPDDRYQSAKELALDLTRIKEGKDVLAYSSTFQNRASNKTNNTEHETASISKIVLVGLASAMLIVSALAFYLVSTQQKAKSAKSRTQKEIATQITPEHYASLIDNGRNIKFEFPKNQSIGKIGNYIGASALVPAQGTVILPAGQEIQLMANDFAIQHSSVFNGFRPADITSLTTPYKFDQSTQVAESMQNICKLVELQRLDVQLSDIGDSSLKYLDQMTGLKVLNLNMTEFTGAGIGRFKGLRKLRKLNFSYNHGFKQLLEALAGSQALQELFIDSPERPLDDADIANLCTLKNLQYLSLKGTALTDNYLYKLAAIPALRLVDVTDCNTTAQGLAQFKKNLGKRSIKVITSVSDLRQYKGDTKGDFETGL